jgi:hypothetical protein
MAVLLLLGVLTAGGQGFQGYTPQSNETPLQRAERARQKLMQRLQEGGEQSQNGGESLQERIARLKRELAEAEAQLANQGKEPFREASAAAVSSGALVVISSEQSEGSGFIAEMRGRTFLITNIHVLGAARGASIQTLDGVEVSLPSHGFVSQRRDVAIVPIKWDGSRLELSQSLSFDEVELGQPVTVMGNSDGARVATRLKGQIRGVGPDALEVSAKFVPGNSGSPIIHDALGKVVAVASHLKDLTPKTKWTEDTELADIRRFGYRLDGEIEWGLVALEDLFQQAEAYHRYEDRTKVMSHIGYMLQFEDKLMTNYRSHESLGYLFEHFDRDFQWHRGTNSSHNQRLLKRFVAGMMTELQSDRQSTQEALQVDFYRRRFLVIEDARNAVVHNLVRFRDSRLD